MPDPRSPLSPLLVDGLAQDTAATVDGAELSTALAAHHATEEGANGEAAGPLAVLASDADALRTLTDPEGLTRVALVADGGLLALQEARHAIQDDPWIELSHVEITLPTGFDSGAATHALLEELAFSVPAYVGVPRTGFDGALDALAADGAEHAAWRCRTEDGVPADGEVAAFVHGCVDRKVGFRITEGLEHAVRADGAAPHHGVLNLLAASAAALGGATTSELADLLGTANTATLLDVIVTVAPRDLRAAFHGFGTHNLPATLAELAATGALPTS